MRKANKEVRRVAIIFTLCLLASCALWSTKVHAKMATVLLTPKNSISFRGPVTPELVDTKMQEIWSKEDNQNRHLFLTVDSPGGYIDSGLDFVEGVKTVRNLHTISLFAASMASAIVQQLPGNRYIISNGVHMYHRARGGVQGQFENGELEARLNSIKYSVRMNLELPNAVRMGLTLEEYKSKVKDEMWLGGQQAIEGRSADLIIAIKCSKELIDGREIIQVATMFGPVSLKFSTCPLMRNPLEASLSQKMSLKITDKAVLEAINVFRSGTSKMDYIYRGSAK